MALTPQNSEAFMREVDDAVRQDQLLTFWQRYGRALAVLLIVIASFDPGLALAGALVYAAAFTAELGLGLSMYFSSESKDPSKQ